MHSFIPVLEKWLGGLSANRVWEWGPGRSTHVILKSLPPEGRLVSVEHDRVWADKIQREVKDDPRWDLRREMLVTKISQYAHRILAEKEKQDLIFIDGRRRVECAVAAFQVISRKGVILLHDACRTSYTDLLAPLIEVIEVDRDTMVFRPKGF